MVRIQYMPSRIPGTAALAMLACGVLLPGCPVGCPPGKPQTIYAPPPEPVAVQRTGRCAFQVLGSMEGRPFPHSKDGFYSVDLDDSPVPIEWVHFTPDTRTITVLEKWCHDGISLALSYQALVRTAFP